MTRSWWKNMILIFLVHAQVYSQYNPEYDGQLSVFSSYNPDNDLDIMLGGRYIPELNYNYEYRSGDNLDFLASASIFGYHSTHPFDKNNTYGDIQPYRIWVRYAGQHLELRLGLQKIDFGSATMLRPLQWFNQIDPRDPLQLTNGVYGGLGRYYFQNNANVWLWVLMGTENNRGYDFMKTYKKLPEFGGRIQYPVPRGEIAFSYNHRAAYSRDLANVPAYQKIPEEKFGIDGKWDVEVGLWVEATFNHKSKNVGILTNQALLNIGVDYTFGVGNGLNVVAEHLISTFDEQAFGYIINTNTTASTLAYPLGFFDNLSSVIYYSWDKEGFSYFLNYEHQFKKFTGYLMAYYNSEAFQDMQQNELLNNFSGSGVRLMLVYNH